MKQNPDILKATAYTAAIVTSLLITACGGRTLIVSEFDTTQVESRATIQTIGPATIHASVLTLAEAKALYGIDLYSGGVQPIWLKVENAGDESLRFAPVGTDPEYFAPLEVAYVNRGGLNKDSRAAMDRRFHDLAMPRHIAAGTAASGVVLTHKEPGTKGFNVELFGSEKSFAATFFITPPGLKFDHGRVDFRTLYELTGTQNVHADDFPSVVNDLACCAANSTSEGGNGLPLNVVLVGEAGEVLAALLRAQWRESELDDPRNENSGMHYLFSRQQDATLRYEGRNRLDGFYELRLWISPLTTDGKPVWIGHVQHFFSHRKQSVQSDPDIDAARDFLWQSLGYAGAVKQFTTTMSGGAKAPDKRHTDSNGFEYISDGERLVLWLSNDPVSLADIVDVAWSQEAMQ